MPLIPKALKNVLTNANGWFSLHRIETASCLLLGSLFLSTASVVASSPEQVLDINPGAGDSYLLGKGAEIDGKAILPIVIPPFAGIYAFDGANLDQLWNLGQSTSYPPEFGYVGDELYAHVRNVDRWLKITGNSAVEVFPDPTTSDPHGTGSIAELTTYAGAIYFAGRASEPSGDAGLYRFDGSSVTLIHSGWRTANLTVVDGILYFTAEFDDQLCSYDASTGTVSTDLIASSGFDARAIYAAGDSLVVQVEDYVPPSGPFISWFTVFDGTDVTPLDYFGYSHTDLYQAQAVNTDDDRFFYLIPDGRYAVFDGTTSTLLGSAGLYGVENQGIRPFTLYREALVGYIGSYGGEDEILVEWQFGDGSSNEFAIKPQSFPHDGYFQYAGALYFWGDSDDGIGSELMRYRKSGDILNLSTRGYVGTGDNVLIGGIVIEGTGTKDLQINARGPSIDASVPGRLVDPEISIHDAAGNVVASNDDWSPSAGLAYPLTASKDAAVRLSLPPGAYTAIVRGVGGTEGIGIVEFFDLDPSGSAVIRNLSTRGYVGTGDNVLIGGIIATDPGVDAIVRGRGPSLGGGALSGSLADPEVSLFQGSALQRSVDDWTYEPEAQALGALQPDSPLESAFRATMSAGGNTAIVGGNGATGLAIIEFFIED